MKTAIPFCARGLFVAVLASAQISFVHAANYALRFMGASDYAWVAHHDALNAYPFTVTAWFRTSQGSGQMHLIHKGPPAGFNGWRVLCDGGNLRAWYYATGTDYVWKAPGGLNGGFVADGQWHHLAFVVDANGGRLYVDGALKDSVPWTGTPGPATSFNDMHFSSASGNAFDGSLDEISVWNIALSQSQVETNRYRNLTGTEAGLVAYYRCDEGAGPMVQDDAPAAGNNHAFLSSGGLFIFPGILPFSPRAQTLSAFGVGTNVVLNGTANPAGTNTVGWFEWGLTTHYGNVTLAQPLGGGIGDTNFSALVSGLVGGAPYQYRAVASNALGIAVGTNAGFSAPVFYEVAVGLPRGSGIGAWGDLDNDGRLDLLLSGNYSTGGLQSVTFMDVVRNTPAGFIPLDAGLPAFRWGSRVIGDYDNDGRLDILVAGFGTDNLYWMELWRNTGTGFQNIKSLPAGDYSHAIFGDFNNDGRPDILFNPLYEEGQFLFPMRLWRNIGGDFTVHMAPRLGNYLEGSSMAWADYDGDGWIDILWMGMTNVISQSIRGPATVVWRNAGDHFTNILAGLPAGIYAAGSVAWGDYDNDGRVDILLAGVAGETNSVQVWRNTGNGFTNIYAAFPPFADGTASWGDYDNDGRLDILLAGLILGTQEEICQVWRNTGSGFALVDTVFTDGVKFAAWGDYDNDGRLDIVLSGTTNGQFSGYVWQLWRNNTPIANTPPLPPSGLTASAIGGDLLLSWDAASDAQTPSAGLTYNVRAGTTPGGEDLVSPSSAASGWRRLPAMGNAQNRLFARFSGFPLDQPIYWSVQAVDTAFAGSAFAPEQVFTTLITPTPPSGVVIPGDTDGDGVVSEDELGAVLENYWPHSAWLYMTNTAGLGGTNVTFALTNATAGAFSVEVSTNLVDWEFLGFATPRYGFHDTNAPGGPQRYYRLRWP
jgi:hypothetical protein